MYILSFSFCVLCMNMHVCVYCILSKGGSGENIEKKRKKREKEKRTDASLCFSRHRIKYKKEDETLDRKIGSMGIRMVRSVEYDDRKKGGKEKEKRNKGGPCSEWATKQNKNYLCRASKASLAHLAMSTSTPSYFWMNGCSRSCE